MIDLWPLQCMMEERGVSEEMSVNQVLKFLGWAQGTGLAEQYSIAEKHPEKNLCHQYDLYNCGVFVCVYMTCLALGYQWPKEKSWMNFDSRRWMMECLVKKCIVPF